MHQHSPNRSTDRAYPSSATLRFCALFGFAGAAVFLISLILLHLNRSGFDWLGEYASDLANGSNGWLFGLGASSHGLGNLALAVGLWLTLEPGRPRNWGVSLFALAATGMLMAAVFSTDPSGAGPTLEGIMHRAAAGLAFFAELASLYLFSIAFQSARFWRPYHGFALTLAVLSTLALTLFLIAIQLSSAAGLVERLALAVFMLFELWVAWRLLIE